MTKRIDRFEEAMKLLKRNPGGIKYNEEQETWSVPSVSGGHHYYKVYHSSHNSWQCECRDWVQGISSDKPHDCKHIIAVKVLQIKKKREEVSVTNGT